MRKFILLLAPLLSLCEAYYASNRDGGFQIGHAYDPRYEMCCGESPYAIADRHQFLKCCGNHQYDTTEQVCCNGTVHSLKKGFGCCGDSYTNLTGYYCCAAGGQEVHAIPEALLGDVGVGKFLNCCCSATYDVRTQICCDCTVVPKTANNVTCCGNATYVSSKGLQCCNGSVVDFPNQYYACCGNQSFDTQTYFCCGNNHYEKLDRYNYRPYNIMNTRDACCGDQRHDKQRQLCCGGNGGRQFIVTPPGSLGYYKCCGNQHYQSNSEICCSGNGIYEVRKKQDNSHNQCCENATFNDASCICCNNTVVEKLSYSDNLCCGLYSYNNWSQICCYDEELRQHRSYQTRYGKQCCGIVPYFPERETCVNKQVIPITRGYCSCAGKRYKEEKTLCCGGNITEKEGINVTYACCGSYAYKIGKEICCYGREVRPITHPGQTSCCVVAEKNSTMCCPCINSDQNQWSRSTTQRPYYVG